MATPGLVQAPATKPSQTIAPATRGTIDPVTRMPVYNTPAPAPVTPATKTTQQAAIPKPTQLQQQYPDALSYGMFRGSLSPENQAGLIQYMRDWATQGGSRGVQNTAGTGMMNYSDVLNEMKGAGMNVSSLPQFAAPSGPANPFQNLLNQYNDIYKGVSGNVASIYGNLDRQVAANRAQFEAAQPRLASQLNTDYASALNDVRGAGTQYQNQLASLAKGMGLPQTQMSDRVTDLGSDLARIAALNATNRAASEANLSLRGQGIEDLLLGNRYAAQQGGAAAQAELATQALNRFGMADPETLLANYESGVQANQLAMLNLDLANQKAAAAAAAAKSGGGRGGRRSGGGSGGGTSQTTSGVTSTTPYDAMRQFFAQNYGTVDNNVLMPAYYSLWRQTMPATMDSLVGQKSNLHGKVPV